MNIFLPSRVYSAMWKLVFLFTLLTGCMSGIEVSDETIDPESGDSGLDDGQLGYQDSAMVRDALREEAGTERQEDSAPSDVGMETIKADEAIEDSQLESDVHGLADGCSTVLHRSPLGTSDYTSCSPLVYAEDLAREQIEHAKTTSPSAWMWSTPTLIFCSGMKTFPTTSGDLCVYVTISDTSLPSEMPTTATWCFQGKMSGRFSRSTASEVSCPYAADAITWW